MRDNTGMNKELHEQDILNQMLEPFRIQAVIAVTDKWTYVYATDGFKLKLASMEDTSTFKVWKPEGWTKLIFDAESDIDKMYQLFRALLKTLDQWEER